MPHGALKFTICMDNLQKIVLNLCSEKSLIIMPYFNGIDDITFFNHTAGKQG